MVTAPYQVTEQEKEREFRTALNRFNWSREAPQTTLTLFHTLPTSHVLDNLTKL